MRSGAAQGPLLGADIAGRPFSGQVNLVSEHIWCEDFLVRSFYLKNVQSQETRTLTQFHFLSWPAEGIPATTRPLLDFRRWVPAPGGGTAGSERGRARLDLGGGSRRWPCWRDSYPPRSCALSLSLSRSCRRHFCDLQLVIWLQLHSHKSDRWQPCLPHGACREPSRGRTAAIPASAAPPGTPAPGPRWEAAGAPHRTPVPPPSAARPKQALTRCLLSLQEGEQVLPGPLLPYHCALQVPQRGGSWLGAVRRGPGRHPRHFSASSSDGAGRTGTYILVDMVLNRMAKGTACTTRAGNAAVGSALSFLVSPH